MTRDDHDDRQDFFDDDDDGQPSDGVFSLYCLLLFSLTKYSYHHCNDDATAWDNDDDRQLMVA